MKRILPFLAVACSGFLVYIFDKIFGSSIDWEKIKSVKIGKLKVCQPLTAVSQDLGFWLNLKSVLYLK